MTLINLCLMVFLRPSGGPRPGISSCSDLRLWPDLVSGGGLCTLSILRCHSSTWRASALSTVSSPPGPPNVLSSSIADAHRPPCRPTCPWRTPDGVDRNTSRNGERQWILFDHGAAREFAYTGTPDWNTCFLNLCDDFACASPLTGSPIPVPYDFTIVAAPPALTLSPASAIGTFTAGDPVPFLINLSATVTGLSFPIYVSVSDPSMTLLGTATLSSEPSNHYLLTVRRNPRSPSAAIRGRSS